MREALASIVEYAKSARCHTEDAHVLGFLKQIENHARKALALPLRNCDVGTAEEQAKRFKEFCRFRACSDCPAGKSSEDIIECEFAWARMPYTEEGGAS